MGTRGFVGVAVDGEVKITYNHWDSYPGGLGAELLEALHKRLNGGDDLDQALTLPELAQKARDLKMVDEDAQPGSTELALFARYADANVGGTFDKPTDGTVQNYYQLLRKLQGNLLGLLDLGVATDAHEFYLDSLFCEYGYLLDFDAGTFQVYEGFQTQRHDKGRWAGLPTDEEITAKYDEVKARLDAGNLTQRQFDYFSQTEYHAVALAAEWPLTDLPTLEEFAAAFEESDEVDA